MGSESPQHVDTRSDGPADARWTVVLAHGAGAGMDSPFMAWFAEGLASLGHRVVRFEFPYMARRRASGRRSPPDREPTLRRTWAEVVALLDPRRTIIGGKSLGGRIASLVADELQVAGLLALGYPFHPIGKPDRERIAHLAELRTPALIVQGERDRFGTPAEVAEYPLSPAIRIEWIADGDHSLEPRKKSGRTTEQNWQAALLAVDRFVGKL